MTTRGTYTIAKKAIEPGRSRSSAAELLVDLDDAPLLDAAGHSMRILAYMDDSGSMIIEVEHVLPG